MELILPPNTFYLAPDLLTLYRLTFNIQDLFISVPLQIVTVSLNSISLFHHLLGSAPLGCWHGLLLDDITQVATTPLALSALRRLSKVSGYLFVVPPEPSKFWAA